MTLLHDSDHLALMTDPTFAIMTPDGKQHNVLPFRLGPQQITRRDMQSAVMQRLPVQGQPQVSLVINPSMPAGTPISMQAQLKKMQPPAVPQIRIPSNGTMRPPAPPNLPTMPTSNASSSQASQSMPASGHANDASVNGGSVESYPPKPGSSESSQELQQPHTIHVDGQTESGPSIQSTSPTRPSSQSQQHAAITIPVMSNGFHISPVNGFSPGLGNNANGISFPNPTGNGLSHQQMQNIKSAYAGISPMHDISAIQANGGNMVPRGPTAYMGHIIPNGVNYEMQLRQMQWNTAQRLSSNGINGSMSNVGGASYSPPLQQGSTGVNGMRGNGMPVSHVIGQGQHSHLQPHASPPLHQSPSPAPNIHSSPPISSSQPPMASPSLQTQQPVGASNGRYT
jgi:enhancer of polycomb-like protein